MDKGDLKDYTPPKDLANAIWGACFDYETMTPEMEERIKEACKRIEHLGFLAKIKRVKKK